MVGLGYLTLYLDLENSNPPVEESEMNINST